MALVYITKSIFIPRADKDLCRDLLFDVRRLNVGRSLSLRLLELTISRNEESSVKLPECINFYATRRRGTCCLIYLRFMASSISVMTARWLIRARAHERLNSPLYPCTRWACSPRRRYSFWLLSRDLEGNSANLIRLSGSVTKLPSTLLAFNSSASM